MRRIAFLYAGQGSQYAGMGRDLYEKNELFRETLDRVASYIQLPIKRLMFEGPEEELSRTSHTQPALAAFAAGVTAVLQKEGITPEYAAGLSLGEYSALYAAGVFSEEQLLRVTAFRGAAMEEAGKGMDTRMCAIIGTGRETVEEVCETVRRATGGRVSVSNYNTPQQTVISGGREAVLAAEALAKEKGAKRCMPLKTSGAFHTPFMEPAAEKLAAFLEKETLGEMQIPVIFNISGRTLEETDVECAGNAKEESEGSGSGKIRNCLRRQVVEGVRMCQTIEYLDGKGINTVIEIGPGRAIAGMVRRTAPEIEVFSVDTAEDLGEIRKLL